MQFKSQVTAIFPGDFSENNISHNIAASKPILQTKMIFVNIQIKITTLSFKNSTHIKVNAHVLCWQFVLSEAWPLDFLELSINVKLAKVKVKLLLSVTTQLGSYSILTTLGFGGKNNQIC